MKLTPTDPRYPRSLYQLDEPPSLTLSRPLGEGSPRTIAIVGSRTATEGAILFAERLAFHLARAGVVVVSGGAMGIDVAAHLGAMRGGRTWLVAPFGRGGRSRDISKSVLERVAASPSCCVLWPFADATAQTAESPRFRNGVLVALSERVVVIQARARSGSRNAASWARKLGLPIHVTPGAPWDEAFSGSTIELASGGAPLYSIESFMAEVGLPKPDLDPRADTPALRLRLRPQRKLQRSFLDPPRFPLDLSSWTDAERVVFSATSIAPTQQDEIIAKTRLSTSSALTALLTLSLKDVVVEGPDGFFRRRDAG